MTTANCPGFTSRNSISLHIGSALLTVPQVITSILRTVAPRHLRVANDKSKITVLRSDPMSSLVPSTYAPLGPFQRVGFRAAPAHVRDILQVDRHLHRSTSPLLPFPGRPTALPSSRWLAFQPQEPPRQSCQNSRNV